MSRLRKNEKHFEEDLKKFSRFFADSAQEIKPKVSYFYEPYTYGNNGKASQLYERI